MAPKRWAGPRFHWALNARPRSTGFPLGSRVPAVSRSASGFLEAAGGPEELGLEDFRAASEASVPASPRAAQSSSDFICFLSWGSW